MYMKIYSRIVAAMALMMMSISAIHAQQWQLDKNHSTVGFSISHMVISEVEGKFDDYTLTLTTSKDDFTDAAIQFEVHVGSINTGHTGRDEHLQEEDLFNVAKYPTLSFVGHSMKQVDGKRYKLTGDFTMMGVTKTLELDVIFNGTIKDNWGNQRAGFKVSGVIDRYDFGLEYNSVLEAGGLSIGREVNLDIKLEMINKGGA